MALVILSSEIIRLMPNGIDYKYGTLNWIEYNKIKNTNRLIQPKSNWSQMPPKRADPKKSSQQINSYTNEPDFNDQSVQMESSARQSNTGRH